MSRLTDLLRRVEQLNPDLAKELIGEFRSLTDRRAFGLNFERHVPETFELANRKVRRGDKVRFLPERSQPAKDIDGRIWLVRRIEGRGVERTADLVELGAAEQPAIAQRRVEDLAVVAEYGDPIYPGLVSTGKVERGGDKPFHAVINAENYHALKALLFAYEGKVDCIYIDPPYNTRDKDWKYNNDYVDADDAYKHSKWLAMMERRLILAKRLLNPRSSVLLLTIDDNELHRLGLLVEQTFHGTKQQIVSVTISPRGRSTADDFSQTNEYILVVYVGLAGVSLPTGSGVDDEIRWRYLRRNDVESARGTPKGGPRQFYPIYVENETMRIVNIGEPLGHDDSLDAIPTIAGTTPVFPIREDGTHMNWGLTGPSLGSALTRGFVRVSPGRDPNQPFTFA